MPIQYQPTKHAFYTEGESLTEQEHKESCDINKMIRKAKAGLQVRGGPQPQYGYDDLTLDGVSHRIQKQQAEEELQKTFEENEFDEKEIETLEKIAPKVASKYKIRKKQSAAESTPTTTPIPDPSVKPQG